MYGLQAHMHLAEIKGLIVLVVFFAGLGGGLLALRTAGLRGLASRLGHANAFASGIILGTGLLHMLPESHDVLHGVYPQYPLAFLLAGLAFFLLLLVEHVLLAHRGHRHGELTTHGQHELADEMAVHATDHRLATYVLLAGLSIHSVLSGIALGAQTNLERALAVFAALVTHKATEGFALGISLARNEVARPIATRLVIAFAVATPLGIAFGAVASRLLDDGTATLFEAIFSAIAAGTFLYIASLDMIGEEFSHGDRPFAKWLWALVGLGLAASLAGH
jgi:zinc transporter 1/2/3